VNEPDATAAFDDAQRRALACVLDLLIPRSRDGRLPAAGELGVAAHVERIAVRDLGLRMTVSEGLAALEERARGRGAAGFAALSAPDRLTALKEPAAAQPAFLPGLVFHTYVGYYQGRSVLEGLGLAPQPPFPKGHVLEPFDEQLLEPARRRGKLYRDA
jgi:hypothetical protein